jgi:hypothetical protein
MLRDKKLIFYSVKIKGNVSNSVYECQGNELGRPGNEAVVATFKYHP